MPDEGVQLSEVHPITEASTGKWILLLVAIAYVARSLFLIFNLRGRLDQVSKDQAASSAQIAELTKRMQSAGPRTKLWPSRLGLPRRNSLPARLRSRASSAPRRLASPSNRSSRSAL